MASESSRRAKRQADATSDERVAQIERELDAWRERAIPDPSAPLEAEDVARLVRGCFDALGLDAGIGESFSVHTVHYYRRKEILDAPEGRTSAARYALRHVWQAAGARLAGQLGLLTLAEAREHMHDAGEASLRRFVATRVADARGRQAARLASRAAATIVRPLRPAEPAPVAAAGTEAKRRQAGEARGEAIYGAASAASPTELSHAPPPVLAASPEAFEYPLAGARSRAIVVPLGGNALCLIPENHLALRSASAARALIDALAESLGITLVS